MDANPWTYQVMGQEMDRWYTDLSTNPSSPQPGDARQYAYVQLATTGRRRELGGGRPPAGRLGHLVPERPGQRLSAGRHRACCARWSRCPSAGRRRPITGVRLRVFPAWAAASVSVSQLVVHAWPRTGAESVLSTRSVPAPWWPGRCRDPGGAADRRGGQPRCGATTAPSGLRSPFAGHGDRQPGPSGWPGCRSPSPPPPARPRPSPGCGCAVGDGGRPASTARPAPGPGTAGAGPGHHHACRRRCPTRWHRPPPSPSGSVASHAVLTSRSTPRTSWSRASIRSRSASTTTSGGRQMGQWSRWRTAGDQVSPYRQNPMTMAVKWPKSANPWRADHQGDGAGQQGPGPRPSATRRAAGR